MTTLIGAVGAAFLACCALPEVLSSIRKGYCGASLSFLLVWFFGELLTLVYIISTSMDSFLLFNYGMNVILILILLYYSRKPINNIKVETIDFTKLGEFK